MPRYDAILFDFDGVLLDSEPLHAACWAEVLAPFGVNLTWEEYREHYIGLDDREMLRIIAAQVRPPLDWQTLWAQYPAKKELDARTPLVVEDSPAGIASGRAAGFAVLAVKSPAEVPDLLLTCLSG